MNFPCQNTGVGSRPLLQWISLTQELNRGLLHCKQILYQLSYLHITTISIGEIWKGSCDITRNISGLCS